MNKNKEFEEWYQKRLNDIRKIMSLNGAMNTEILKVFVRINKIRNRSYEAGQEAEQKKDHWIKGIPEVDSTSGKSKDVLVKSDRGERFICCYVDRYGWAGDSEFSPFTKIVAWQPLP